MTFTQVMPRDFISLHFNVLVHRVGVFESLSRNFRFLISKPELDKSHRAHVCQLPIIGGSLLQQPRWCRTYLEGHSPQYDPVAPAKGAVAVNS